MPKFQYFDGVRFYADNRKNGAYYKNSTLKEYMHRYVWKYYNGDIPDGYHVHHVDGDKSNNDIKNLQLIKKEEHLSMHAKTYHEENKEFVKKNLRENAQPKAREWHKSEAGHEYHKEQYKKGLKNFFENKVVKTCEQCGKDFETINTKKPRFCSANCRSKNRRESGVDNEERTCANCGKIFIVNKYKKTKTCSRSCTKKKYWDDKKR
jgi:hypothetical protein